MSDSVCFAHVVMNGVLIVTNPYKDTNKNAISFCLIINCLAPADIGILTMPE